MNLRQCAGGGKALRLHIKDNGKFELSDTWSSTTSSMKGSSIHESLDELILKGVFRSFDFNISKEILPARASINDRRELAVKLGFCLMNFFDADFASNRIYFRDHLPYLAFASDLPVPTNLENFRMGHPALLSFAKLLLELDFGQIIEIEISSDFSTNIQAWCQLLGRIEQLEQERSDSYIEAIRGCFMVPYKISKALRSRRSKNEDAESIIRKHLYKQIVHKLKLGYDQSNLVSTRQRQRPHSITQSGHWYGDQTSNSATMAKRSASVELEQTISGKNKKRRMPKPQVLPNLSGPIREQSGNLCDNERKTLTNGFADSYVPTLLINDMPSFSLH